MANEVQMMISVDEDLQFDFAAAVSIDHQPPEKVIGEFMRSYVEERRVRQGNSDNAVISAAQRRARENAVNFARSSVALEGFTPSVADEDLAQQFIAGEISLAEFAQPQSLTHASASRDR